MTMTMTFDNGTMHRAIVSGIEAAGPIYGEFSTDIEELLEAIVAGVLGARDAAVELAEADLEEYAGNVAEACQDIAEEFADEVISDLENAICNGVSGDWVDCRMIYTSDIKDYYVNNTYECDEALLNCYDGLQDFDTPGDAITMAVALALANKADEETWEVHHDLTQNLVDHVRDVFEA